MKKAVVCYVAGGVLVALAASGCTPEIRNYLDHDLKKEMHTFSFHHLGPLWGEETNPEKARINQLQSVCAGGEAERRVVSMNGVADQVHYIGCAQLPPPPLPERMSDRPPHHQNDYLTAFPTM